MHKVDWGSFCRLRHIDYIETAASTARGYINVHCPLCSVADQGYHLGLHRSGRWTCFRDPVGHRGNDPRKIIILLTGCSYEEAESFVQGDVDIDTSDFDQAAAIFLTSSGPSGDDRQLLTFPEEFQPLTSQRGRAKIYWDYLLKRGFSTKEVPKVARRYGLHYCDRGNWRGRIIIPVYVDAVLMSWTGRTVYEMEALRYRSLSHASDAIPRAVISIRDMLFNYDNAARRNYHTCVLVEGPLDAIKVDYYGHNYGVCSVATFGTGIRRPQLDLLEHLRIRCRTLIVCGDVGAEANIMDLLSTTRGMRMCSIDLPAGVRDPAELNKQQVRQLFTEL